MITHRVHPEKKGIRVLGIAESSKRQSKRSALAGVVMRRDLVIDGMVFGNVTPTGDDSADAILKMFDSLNRQDITCIMIGGLVISMYNVVDAERIFEKTGLPLVAVTFEESGGLEKSFKHRFENWEEKLALYNKLVPREKVVLKTGKEVYIQCWGLSRRKAVMILNSFTLQGALPEPIRVAKIAAKSLSAML